jgi:hypothetical protein
MNSNIEPSIMADEEDKDKNLDENSNAMTV